MTNKGKKLNNYEKEALNLLNNTEIDKGDVSSRSNGYSGGVLGGEMTKRLTDIGKEEVINKYKS